MPRRGQGPRLRFLEKRDRYYIVWSQGGRSRERSTGTADIELAKIELAKFLTKEVRRAGPRDPSEILITDILAEHAEERGQVIAAPERLAYAIVPLADFFEGLTVADVTPVTCRAYLAWRGKSAGTMRRELGVLRAAINFSHRHGRITRPVCVVLPPRPEPQDRWLTRTEAARLLSAALAEPRVRPYLPLFILIGLYTGQRKETILSLRWSQIDLQASVIDFNQSGRRRTTKRRPRVRIARRLLPHIKRARAFGSDLGPVLHRNGKPIADIKKGFAAACQRAGLAHVSPHVLRHTSATWLMQRGVPLWEVSGFLGMSVETLQRVYGHHHPDHLKIAADAF